MADLEKGLLAGQADLAGAGFHEIPQLSASGRERSSVVSSTSSDRTQVGEEEDKYDLKAVYAQADRDDRKALLWVNGLRGLSALLIYQAHHVIETATEDQACVFLGSGNYKCNNIMHLPFLRLLPIAGFVCVPLFFLTSGFVLVRKPIRLAHRGDQAGAMKYLSNSLIKRTPKLFLPLLAVTMFFSTFFHVVNFPTTLISRNNSLWSEYYELLHHFYLWASPLRDRRTFWGPFVRNFPAWTIPVEAQCSMLVYCMTFATLRLSPALRLAIFAYGWWLLFNEAHWHATGFLLGTMLSELQLLWQAGKFDLLPGNTPARVAVRKWLNIVRQTVAWVGIVIALYVDGQPGQPDKLAMLTDRDWNPLYQKMPLSWQYDTEAWRWFYPSVGALCICLGILNLPILRRLLERPTMQWFGQYSFALYLVHAPILLSFGRLTYALSGSAVFMPLDLHHMIGALRIPAWGPDGLRLNYLVPQLFLFPLTMGAAVLAHHYIIVPTVIAIELTFSWMFKCAWLQPTVVSAKDEADARKRRNEE